MTSNSNQTSTQDAVIAALAPIVDPDLGLSIVDLGLVYDVRVEGGTVEIDMTLTSMGCPAGEYLYDAVRQIVSALDWVEHVTVNLVWDPPWTEERVEPALRFALGLY